MENAFRKRFIDIELEKLAGAAARRVELPPRCSNKGGGVKTSMFIERLRESFFAPPPRRARPADFHQPLMRQNPIKQALFEKNCT